MADPPITYRNKMIGKQVDRGEDLHCCSVTPRGCAGPVDLPSSSACICRSSDASKSERGKSLFPASKNVLWRERLDSGDTVRQLILRYLTGTDPQEFTERPQGAHRRATSALYRLPHDQAHVCGQCPILEKSRSHPLARVGRCPRSPRWGSDGGSGRDVNSQRGAEDRCASSRLSASPIRTAPNWP